MDFRQFDQLNTHFDHLRMTKISFIVLICGLACFFAKFIAQNRYI